MVFPIGQLLTPSSILKLVQYHAQLEWNPLKHFQALLLQVLQGIQHFIVLKQLTFKERKLRDNYYF